MKAKLIQANSLHIPLANESVQTCVTSPPYYGLRDYGTAEWVGGDPECQHIVGNQVQDNKWDGAIQSGIRPGCDASTCKKCGAIRKDKQLGLEPTLSEYIENMCLVFDEVWRVLRDDGTLWLNMGDSYNGSGGAGGDYNAGGLKDGQPKYPGRNDGALKPKDLMGVPWRLAFALQERGWYLRSDIIWHKPNPMPESVTDRPTKSHEYIFLLTKNARYYYDADAIRETQKPQSEDRYNYSFGGKKNEHLLETDNQTAVVGDREFHNSGRNKRTVWTVTTKPYSGAHFATFPPDLIEPCILAGTSEKGQCPECGAPWERVVESIAGIGKLTPKTVASHHARGGTGIPTGTVGKAGSSRIDPVRNTTGWQPTCEHEHESVPQIVLDIFGGSGTTAMVSQAHGRIGISLDLSWEYLQLAKERCGIKQMEEWQNGKKAEETDVSDLPLFNS